MRKIDENFIFGWQRVKLTDISSTLVYSHLFYALPILLEWNIDGMYEYICIYIYVLGSWYIAAAYCNCCAEFISWSMKHIRTWCHFSALRGNRYCQTSNIRHRISKLEFFSSRLAVAFAQSIEARCYIWVISNSIAYWYVTYIRGLMEVGILLCGKVGADW